MQLCIGKLYSKVWTWSRHSLCWQRDIKIERERERENVIIQKKEKRDCSGVGILTVDIFFHSFEWDRETPIEKENKQEFFLW